MKIMDLDIINEAFAFIKYFFQNYTFPFKLCNVFTCLCNLWFLFWSLQNKLQSDYMFFCRLMIIVMTFDSKGRVLLLYTCYQTFVTSGSGLLAVSCRHVYNIMIYSVMTITTWWQQFLFQQTLIRYIYSLNWLTWQNMSKLMQTDLFKFNQPAAWPR